MTDKTIKALLERKNNLLPLFETVPPKAEYILQGLPLGALGSIVAAGGCGKSALALQIAATVAGGPDRLEIEPARGRVAYLVCEDSPLSIHHRLFALGEHCSPAERAAIAENLVIDYLDSERVDVMDEQWMDFITARAEGRQLLIIDTLRQIHTEDENDSTGMARVLNRLQILAARTGCAVIFLHHTSKQGERDGSRSAGASRGSSVLTTNVRWQAYVRSMTNEEAENYNIDQDIVWRYVEFGISKQNQGSKLSPRWLHRISCTNENVDMGYGFQRVKITSEPQKIKPKTKGRHRNEYTN
ncbi:helicase RepA family protein [Aeromonas caviae]|uniref:helicase RepA family protein n=1 Tax=Aeromonas caviae TaxID=648 RepID=UPI0021DF4B94|nr:helicase RepA family protein [Aeromonas caviae]MCU9922501.1 helicase RepA family protein [Aeromonas caviae]